MDVYNLLEGFHLIKTECNVYAGAVLENSSPATNALRAYFGPVNATRAYFEPVFATGRDFSALRKRRKRREDLENVRRRRGKTLRFKIIYDEYENLKDQKLLLKYTFL